VGWYQWERGKRWRDGKDVSIWYKCCIQIHVIGKMRLLVTIPGKGGRVVKENGGGGEFQYDIFNIL
jgi:hypothetical protein